MRIQRGNRGLICQTICPVLFYLVISRSCFPILCPCDESPGFCQHLVLVASRFIRENKLQTYFTALLALGAGVWSVDLSSFAPTNARNVFSQST